MEVPNNKPLLRTNVGEGLTPTEQFLKQLGEHSFLRFWSHANPHRAPGKELCDLLVVCGNYVVLFSDKSVAYQFDRDQLTAWGRWYREAIEESARQLSGAERHLLQQRAKIYKDRACTVPLSLPIPIPS